MAGTKLGQTNIASGSALVVTGSAYAALDSLGAPFPILAATPNRGGLLAHVGILDSGTANVDLRLHFYREQPSGVTAGVHAAIDARHYIGYVDVTTWVSAHGSASYGQNDTVNLALRGDTQGRVWCALQAVGAPTFGDPGNRPLVFLGILQD